MPGTAPAPAHAAAGAPYGGWAAPASSSGGPGAVEGPAGDDTLSQQMATLPSTAEVLLLFYSKEQPEFANEEARLRARRTAASPRPPPALRACATAILE